MQIKNKEVYTYLISQWKTPEIKNEKYKNMKKISVVYPGSPVLKQKTQPSLLQVYFFKFLDNYIVASWIW